MRHFIIIFSFKDVVSIGYWYYSITDHSNRRPSILPTMTIKLAKKVAKLWRNHYALLLLGVVSVSILFCRNFVVKK